MDLEIMEIYEQLPQRIAAMSNSRVRMDLKRMYKNCENLRRAVAQEQVNCRNQRDSHRLWDLRNKFTESVTSLDQYVTLALLST
jgi:hypothetical protein